MKKILVVEDDRILCTAITHKLTKEGFDFVLAHDGIEGLAKAESDKPDLILLDILMPKMDGLDMLKKLRDGGNKTPVLVLTNLNENKNISAEVEGVTSGYLVKSNYSLNDIVNSIKKILG